MNRYTTLTIAAAVSLTLAGSTVPVAASAGAARGPSEAANGVRLTGLFTSSVSTATNSVSPKTATAQCPPGQVVVGGGGYVSVADDPVETNVTLTKLLPFDGGPYPDGYTVGASENAGTSRTWSVVARVVCADTFASHHIVSASTPYRSDQVQTADAPCAAGERVLGTGASISSSVPDERYSGVRLQVARADGSGVVARARAQEQPAGYAATWRVRAFAVCGDQPEGYEISYGDSTPDRFSETTKTAVAGCTGQRRLVNGGAAITDTAPGHVGLTMAAPFVGGWPTAFARAVENNPLDTDWDFIVAQAICVVADL